MASEIKLQSKIIKYLKKNADYVNRITKATFNGICDLFFVLKGVTYFIEVKDKDSGKIAPIQQYVIAKLNKHSKIAFIIDDYDEFLELYEKLK